LKRLAHLILLFTLPIAFAPRVPAQVTGGGTNANDMRHFRTGTCVTNSAGQCTISAAFPGGAFPDTNYTAVCNFETNYRGPSQFYFQETKSTSGLTLAITFYVAESGVTTPVIDCIAIHD